MLSPRRLFSHRLAQAGVVLLVVVLAGCQAAPQQTAVDAQATTDPVVAPTDGPLRGDLETAGAAVHIMPNPLEDISAYRKQLAQTAAWAAGRFDLVLAFTLTSFFGVDVANELNLPSVWRIGETETLATVVHWLGGRLDPAVGLRAQFAFELDGAARD